MKSERLLKDLTKFCEDHPDLRLWQAICVWSGADFIRWEKKDYYMDTFYLEGKNPSL